MTAEAVAETRKDWGARLRASRLGQGLTQADVAERTGIDQASVSRAEAGAGSLETMLRLAKALGVALDVQA